MLYVRIAFWRYTPQEMLNGDIGESVFYWRSNDLHQQWTVLGLAKVRTAVSAHIAVNGPQLGRRTAMVAALSQ